MSESESPPKKKIIIQASALEPEPKSDKQESKEHQEENKEESEKPQEEHKEESKSKEPQEEHKEESEEHKEESEEHEKDSQEEANKKENKHSKGDSHDKGDDSSRLINEIIPWNIIDKLFHDNPNLLVAHHIDSYNEFMTNGIRQIFREHNPIVFQKEKDEKTDTFRNVSRFYLGGKNGDKIYYGKPVIYDETGTTSRVHYMYPNEARLRNMTYGVTIHYDVDVEFDNVVTHQEEEGEQEERKHGSNEKTVTVTLPQILLGKFPIMVHSNLCILTGLPKDVAYNLGEDKSDHGGYFIIDGKEKTVIAQEKFADNMLYIRKMDDEQYTYSAEIRSVSENVSKPIRTLSVKIMAPTKDIPGEGPKQKKYTYENIVVNIPNVRKPVPLFIVFRALGILSDKDIITIITITTILYFCFIIIIKIIQYQYITFLKIL